MARTEQEIQSRRAIEIAWATHLDTCMDPECATCYDFEAQIRAEVASRRNA